MSNIGKQANYLDGVPRVASSAQRDILFPAPDTYQRVHNDATHTVEIYDGANWLPVIALEKSDVRGRSVKAYGAKGNGSNNDAGAIQDAITDAGIGGQLIFPPGIYYMGGTQLTGLQQQSWQGQYQLGTGSVPGSDGRVCLTWDSSLGSNNGVVAGVNQLFRRIMFQGAGKNVTTGAAVISGDVSHSNHSRYDWCQFYDFGHAVNTTNGFYVAFDTCEFVRLAVSILATSAFNMQLMNCTARLWDAITTNTGGTLFSTSTSVRHLALHGGSVEGFNASGGIILGSTGSLLDLFGVYFESSVVGSNAVGIQVSGNQNTVNAFGCQVYLSELNRWMNLSGLDKCYLTGKGNRFVCSSGSTSNPIAYVPPTNTTGGFIDLAGDAWDDVALAGAVYISSLNAPIQQHARVVAPSAWNSPYNALEVCGRPMLMSSQSAAPASPLLGTIATADRTNWNPVGVSSADPYTVVYDGTRWNPASRPTFIGSKTFDPPSVANGAQTTTTVTVTGSALGDMVQVSFSLDVQGMQLSGKVSVAGTVTVVLKNDTGGAIDLASGTLTAVCTRY